MDFSIIICSRQADIRDELRENICKTIGNGCSFEIIVVDNHDNKYSIFEAYNVGVKQANGGLLVFMHDDVEYRSCRWGCLVKKYLKPDDIGACAVCGVNYNSQFPHWYAVGHGCHLMNILYSSTSDDSIYEYCDYDTVEDIVVFDGAWFCIKRSCFDKVRFDDKQYQGFHFYDIDISTQLVANGYRIVTAPKIKVLHKANSYHLDSLWTINCFAYFNKWKDVLPLRCSGTPSFSPKELTDIDKEGLFSTLKPIIYHIYVWRLLPEWLRYAKRALKTPLSTIAVISILHHHYKKT